MIRLGCLKGLICLLIITFVLYCVYFPSLFQVKLQYIAETRIFSDWFPQLDEELHDFNNNLTCTVPQLNPWDPSIIDLIDHYPPLKCDNVQVDLLIIDDRNYLRFNDDVLKALNLTEKDFECRYMTIDRSDGQDDFDVDYGPNVLLKEPVQLQKDLLQAQCIRIPSRDVVYANLLTSPVPKTNKNYINVSESVLNVVMIFMDSMSLSAVKRHMPKTLEFLEKNMSFHFLTGYNKIADNTFPNVIPILTGKRAYHQQPDMKDEFSNYSRAYFDNWPLIWKNFSNKGYVTAFNEDWPDLGLFHMRNYGFTKKPVDHFYLNYWNGLQYLTFPKPSTKHCYGNWPQAQLLLDNIRKHFRIYPHQAQFLYNFLTYPSHTNAAMQEMVDPIFLQFFRDMHQSETFNHSFVLFLSDHGQRSSAVLTTTVGQLEERLPFVSLYLPPWFLAKHPHIGRSLAQNRDRLSSNYDLYQTLVDLLRGNFDGKQQPTKSRSFSLLYPLPERRTCPQAGVPYFFCTCQELVWNNVSTLTEVARYSGADFLNELNQLIRWQSNCLRWNLKDVLAVDTLTIAAERPDLSAQLVQAESFRPDLQLYRVTVLAEVGRITGTFQALMLYKKRESKFKLHSDVSRLDRYGSQSDCVKDLGPDIRKICLCKDFLRAQNSGVMDRNVTGRLFDGTAMAANSTAPLSVDDLLEKRRNLGL